jgi:RNA polymerase sigma-70 factor (ECF subfamily)
MMVTRASQPATIEEHLVQRAAGGDRAAFGELYSRYARVVHSILLARVRCHEAEDLMQDVFLTAMSRLSQLRDSSSFSSWICTIARNRAHDFHRGQATVDEIREDHLKSRPGQGAQTAAEAMSALEAIRSLPEAYRETLLLRLVEGMTGPEIALRTGLTHESVRVNLCRGMKLLREKIEGKTV